MAYKLFTEINLIDSFRIPAQEFINFFHALEMGYHDNPCEFHAVNDNDANI